MLAETAEKFGSSEFQRREFNDEAEHTSTRTEYLNGIADEVDWFRANRKGGDDLFVMDYGAREDDITTAAKPSQLAAMADNVLERHQVEADLSHVNFSNWEEVVETVNRTVGEAVLNIQSEANDYRLTEDVVLELPDSEELLE